MHDDSAALLAKLGCFGCLGLLVLGAIGIAGLCVANALWSEEHGYTARIQISNQTSDAIRVRVASNERGYLGCDDRGSVGAMAAEEVNFVVYGGDSFYCPASPEAIEFRTAAEAWLCPWDDAKDREPVVVTDSGPQCDYVETSVTPASITIDNQADIHVQVLLNFNRTSECWPSDILAPRTSRNVSFDFDFYCLDTSLESIKFSFVLFSQESFSTRQWTCDWRAAKQAEPVVVALDGPVHPALRATCIAVETAY